MSERAVPPEAWHRLHPLTVLAELLRLFGQFAYVLVAIVAARFLGGGERFDDLYFAALGGVGVLVALLRYFTLRYAVWEGTLYLRRGVVFRQARTIPVDRIQNIDLKQSLLGRLTGVVDVKIETASGSGSEAELSVLSRAAAERLKAALASRQAATAAEPQAAAAPAAPRVPLWQATLGDLLLLGATQNRAGAILGGLASLYFVVGGYSGVNARAGVDAARALGGLGAWAAAAAALLALALLVAGGWILSILFTVVKYAGFTLAEAGDGRLLRSYGLITRYESVIPLRRVQALRLVANWPRRALGYWTVFAETAGSFVDKEAGGASIVVPLLDARERAAFARHFFPGLDLDAAAWQPVSRHAIRRGFLRAARLILLVFLLAGISFGRWPWWILPPLLVLAALWAWLRWRALRWARAGEFWLASGGVWRRTVWIVPEAKIQWVAVEASPFQRRLAIATLEVATAGAGPARGTEVVDLPAATARALAAALAARAAAAGALQPDGV
ncbi:MAG: PH domain-containing protein [Acidobacteria bacterium]|nr:PH domain-containing protein [Acidobacteriota bacterium]